MRHTETQEKVALPAKEGRKIKPWLTFQGGRGKRLTSVIKFFYKNLNLFTKCTEKYITFNNLLLTTNSVILI